MPVAYQSSLKVDFFFVNNQGNALKKLFDHNLRIPVKNQFVDLVVKLCVSKFQEGHLQVSNKLDRVIQCSVDPQRPTVLDLSYVSNHRELIDVKFSLRNKGCFEVLCERLNAVLKVQRNIKYVNLSTNEISQLEPMSKLSGSTVIVLDLRYNKIHSIEEFHHLKNLNVQEIFLIGNPVANTSMYMEHMRAILPTLKTIDSNNIGKSFVANTPSQLQFDNRSGQVCNFNINCKVIRSVDVNDLVKQEFEKFRNSSWNKVVVVHNGKISKTAILDEMNKQLFKRIQFYPSYYKQEKKLDSFLLHENFTALTTLIQNNLTMKIPGKIPSSGCKVKFEIHLNCSEWCEGQINWRNKLNYVTQKRMKGSKFDLDSFANDSDLTDLDVPMSVASLEFILNIGHQINPKILSISLKHNKISAVEGLNYLKNFNELVSIDLRDNGIKGFEGFPVLTTIMEVKLDRNPFCSIFYNEPWRYVRDLHKVFPNLEFIDGYRIDDNLIPIVPMQNFLVSQSLYTLTESFIKFFFNLYDSVHRKSLKKLYEAKSLFTLSSELDCQNIYEYYSRNLMKINRAEMNNCNLFVGIESIIQLFEKFPQTTHDYTTMKVDVPLMTRDNVMIVVNGYFKDIAKSLNESDVVYAFTRTFFLQRSSEQTLGAMENTFSYCVKNEQLHIRNVDVTSSLKAFKTNVVTDEEMRTICKDLLPSKSEEEEANILLLNRLTQLDKKLCKRFVKHNDSPHDYSLVYFTDFYMTAIGILRLLSRTSTNFWNETFGLMRT